jgi:hypothetical protein
MTVTNFRAKTCNRIESYNSPYYATERFINGMVQELHESRFSTYEEYRLNWHSILGMAESAYKKLTHLRKDSMKKDYWAGLRVEVLANLETEEPIYEAEAIQEVEITQPEPLPTDAVIGDRKWTLVYVEISRPDVTSDCGEVETELFKLIVSDHSWKNSRSYIITRIADRFPTYQLQDWWQPYAHDEF